MVVPESVAGSPEDLHALLVTEKVSVLSQTPSAVAMFSPEGLESVALLGVVRRVRSRWWIGGRPGG